MTTPAFLGNGLLRPFRRDQKNDFANASGRDLIEACAGQILGTRCSAPGVRGEIPWRAEFGSRLFLLRHKPINATTIELARHYAQEALQRWEPRIIVSQAQAYRRAITPRVLFVPVNFDVIDRNVPGNQVVLAGLSVTVPIAE